MSSLGRLGIGNVSQRSTPLQGGNLVGGLVIAGGAAGFAVHESVFADADVELRLTEDAELIAIALVFRHFALAAAKFSVAGSGGHCINVIARRRNGECAVGNVGGDDIIFSALRRVVPLLFRLIQVGVPYNSEQ